MNTGVLLAAMSGSFESGLLAGLSLGLLVALGLALAFVAGCAVTVAVLKKGGLQNTFAPLLRPVATPVATPAYPIPAAAPAVVVPPAVAVPVVEPVVATDAVVEETALEEVTVGPPVVAEASEEEKRPKFFLSYAALVRAVFSPQATVTMEDLERCLFCISKAELALALREEDRSGRTYYELLMPVIDKAKKEGRLLYTADTTRFKPITFGQVNEFLARNNVAPLFVAGGMGDTSLEAIPMYACVPRISDNSYEILWAEYPLIGNWRECWGDEVLAERLTIFIDADDQEGRALAKEQLDAEETGPDDPTPLSGDAAWMKDLGRGDQRPVIDTGFRPEDGSSSADEHTDEEPTS
ncbi:MAG: hypothetical protein K2W82_16105 [Candidatus Obscuribacterales bacterium]|nr:hypothetical protein [Candidatus Obscuribacterales bacterium]